MKKILLTLMLCSLISVTGCTKKQNEPKLPKSIQTYQQLNLTPEQNKKLSQIRAEQRQKIEKIRNEIELKRQQLIESEEAKKLPEAKKKENLTKYRTAANEMREKLLAERLAYDNAMMSILDDKQKKTYQKYLNLREKEKEQRSKDFQKQAKNKK